uniref:Uncharacterized protein n=1 Tax=Alexandrium monilatum TaxID=311494 RepID=A0A7S4V1A1_9DINO
MSSRLRFGALYTSLALMTPDAVLLLPASRSPRSSSRSSLGAEADALFQSSERHGAQARAAGMLHDAIQGLTDWASTRASLQQLNFMSRFQHWLGDHSFDNAGVEDVLDRLLDSAEWVDCTQEPSRCACPGGVVRYGIEESWVYKNFSEPFDCKLDAFARDPSPGSLKICQCKRTAELTKWESCSLEGRSCHCDGMARYGMNAQWVYKNFSGDFSCDNEAFGRDPAPGEVKECHCRRSAAPPSRLPTGGSHPTDGPLLWSCGLSAAPPPGSGSPAVPELTLVRALQPICNDKRMAGLFDVSLDARFLDAHARWASQSGWLEEAYVTYMAGKKNSNFEWMATNLIRSVHLFSTRPIVVVNFDLDFTPPQTWADFPNLLVYRMIPAPGIPFNFNKIRAMIGARIHAGIQADLDQVVFAGMDSFFNATRREITEQYPYPIMPVHWMAREGNPGEPYAVYAFTDYSGVRSMRWNHAHPTWSYWALPFLSDMMYERLTASRHQRWMDEDEDMLNVELWQHGVDKAWCKFDLEPGLYADSLQADMYSDPHWYPAGVPLLFFGAHNTKRVEETDWLLTIMSRCAERKAERASRCPRSDSEACQRRLARPSELEDHLATSEKAAPDICCCVRRREDMPVFWEGKWYKEPSEVPTRDSSGRKRHCLMP